MRGVIDQLDPNDLMTCGYPPENIWKPLEELGQKVSTPKRAPLSRYRLQRRLIVKLRAAAQRGGLFRKLLSKFRLACDVLLRE